jgi:hypothetical protein
VSERRREKVTFAVEFTFMPEVFVVKKNETGIGRESEFGKRE